MDRQEELQKALQLESIEAAFQEKVLLYQDLIEILSQEQKSLRETEVDALWHFSDKKQNIANKIELLRSKILDLLSQAAIQHKMDKKSFNTSKIMSLLPKTTGRQLNKLHLTLTTLKNDVHLMSKQNKAYVEEYLSVLDEMLGLITNAGKPETVYNKNCYLNKSRQTNLLLHREV